MDAEPEVHAFSDERAISDKVEPELRRGVKIHKILQKFGRLWASSVAATVGRSVGRKKKKQKKKKKHKKQKNTFNKCGKHFGRSRVPQVQHRGANFSSPPCAGPWGLGSGQDFFREGGVQNSAFTRGS